LCPAKCGVETQNIKEELSMQLISADQILTQAKNFVFTVCRASQNTKATWKIAQNPYLTKEFKNK
jgi:tRNA threonylcarbamoyladenosine modification (KEOPS) complex Cgi121 subunit